MKRWGSGRVLWIAGGAAAVFSIAAAVGIWGLGAPGAATAVSPQDAVASVGTRQAAAIQPLTGPWFVAVQAGHWQVQELPDELSRVRGDTGAEWGAVKEVNVNKSVADALISLLEADGIRTQFVPATVPPGLRADAFIAIHADATSDTSRSGWKLAPPWRSSRASRSLADALSASFSQENGLTEDAGGITVNMRGYYAFSSQRFEHAISPYTPAVIVELGFISNTADRARLTADPGYYAKILARGIETYFKGRSRSETADLQPMQLPWIAAGAAGVVVRRLPNAGSGVMANLEAGTGMIPVDESGDWYEVFLRRPFATGWVLKSDVVVTDTPPFPFRGFPRPPAGQ